MKVAKNELASIDYGNELDLLLPYCMMKAALWTYGDGEVDIGTMWCIVSKNKKIDTKGKQYIVSLFQEWFYEDDETYTWDKKINLCSVKNNEPFIIISIGDIVKIIENNKISGIKYDLAITLRLYSHMDGKCIYMKHDELLEFIKHEYAPSDLYNINNSDTWFVNYTTKELEQIARMFIAYPGIEELLYKRYDSDETYLENEFISRKNFDTRMKKLENMGILCKVNTTYGPYCNKVVYCRVEHKDIAEALYRRLDQQREISRNNK